jgi:hypothetical protein
MKIPLDRQKEVCQVMTAVTLLQNINILNPEPQLCINRDNVIQLQRIVCAKCKRKTHSRGKHHGLCQKHLRGQ